MIKEVNGEFLKKWKEGGGENSEPYFILVKTPGCKKCEALLQNEKIFRNLDWFRIYTFTPQDAEGGRILQEIGITSVPFFLIRFKMTRGNFYKYALNAIYRDDAIEYENIFDAIYANDFKFFGYNEYDEKVSDDDNYSAVRLLHEIYGEIDSEVMEERNLFKNQVTN
jgi:hypothetical protein